MTPLSGLLCKLSRFIEFTDSFEENRAKKRRGGGGGGEKKVQAYNGCTQEKPTSTPEVCYQYFVSFEHTLVEIKKHMIHMMEHRISFKFGHQHLHLML